jgi:peptide/nickel transport system ATP-binding protein
MSSVLSIKNLTINLPAGGDRAYAVRDISFTVEAGELLCVLGESGSGKSIIAQTVMGLLPQALRVSQGEILLAGENLLQMSEVQLRERRGDDMAMIFQEPMTALNPVMPCGEQLDEMLAVHTELSADARQKRILQMFEQVKLPDPPRILAAYPHQLSGGQRQRVMIAMALILGPALLIADEPTTALDVTTQAEILKLIATLQKEKGTAVMFITHDMGVVAEIADRVVVLNKGEMVEQGNKHAVLKTPRENYTKALLAAVPSLTPKAPIYLADSAEVLKTEALCKTYVSGGFFSKKREVHAAKDVGLSIRRGETVGIVGESGSGKSTVARCITRLIEPSSGKIQLLGQAVQKAKQSDIQALRKKVQIVFQDPYRSLNPRQRVGDAMMEGPMNFGLSKTDAKARVLKLLDLVRLTPDSFDRYPSEFSGGQRQRLCIARALAMEPELLVCDEAVSALDVSVQAQILELLEDIQSKLQLAILFITHDLRVAAQICDRILVMQHGIVVEQGVTSEVFNQPQQAYTQALLAAAPGRDYLFGKA